MSIRTVDTEVDNFLLEVFTFMMLNFGADGKTKILEMVSLAHAGDGRDEGGGPERQADLVSGLHHLYP